MRLPLIAVAMATTATMASAQTAPPPPASSVPPPAATYADPGNDAPVTKADWQARSAARFDRLDTNHDGMLDSTERAAMRDRRRGPGGRPPAPVDY